MATIRLVYYSQTSDDMSQSELKHILEQARTNNQQHDICGMLCYDNHYFLQILEGDAAEVTALFLTIAADKRHHSVVITGVQETEKRIFPHWSMGYAGGGDELLAMMKELGCDNFDPTQMSFIEAATLLHQLSKSQTRL
ncbi:Blue light-and temperature-regulated antirepressor YcgF [Vibrio aerogenes CECT 7868]|uniref:Blue light-and temperature-regulated antirepressor YcgF n=1 Tax=Vibrio aerogenes CECT 7868 TaxID=1216006 RepID=A0A1M5Z416_9VIBR|nr:BLUF domain-containing protein [Vibrio aerogenes]SHI18921.1 Blue light-and temperature-regulated antirepressor YcgF [Vibrio aerogenes CECT 7868]